MEQIKRIDNTTIEIDGVLYKAEETTKQGNLDEVERLVLGYVRNKGYIHCIYGGGNIGTSQNISYNHSTENHTKARRLKILWEMLAKVLNKGELDWSKQGNKKECIYLVDDKDIKKGVTFFEKTEGTTYFKQGVIDKAISLFGEDNLLFMIKNS